MTRRWLRPALIVVAACGVALLLWLHGPNWHAVLHTLARMDVGWAAAAIGLNLGSAIVRGLAWRIVVHLAIEPPFPSLVDIFSAFFIGIFANGVLPARVGEVARVGVLVRRQPRRAGLWPALLGSVVAHRLLELVPSIALIVWVLAAARIPGWAHLALLTVAAVAILLLAAGAWAARRPGARQEARPVRAIADRLREGLGVLRSPRATLAAGTLQAAAWALQLAAVWAALRALELPLSVTVAAVVLALINVALILPLWPGNVGVQQAAVALPLVGYGVAYARGFAFGIGLQAIESSVGYVLGVVFLVREGLTLGAVGRLARRRPER